MPRIVIVGGGISGLALAYFLEQRLPSAEVVLLEKNAALGGTIQTQERDGFRVEAGPNGFLDNKSALLSLCRQVGVDNRLIAASDAAGKNRFVFLKDRLRLLPGGLWPFLKSDLLSWSAKFSLLTERFRSRKTDDSDESIHDFACRRVGGEVADTLADAFVTGIYAGDPKLLSVQATLPRIAAMEREHGSVVRGMGYARRQRQKEAKARGEPPGRASGRMWSFAPGLGVLIATLRQRLRAKIDTQVSTRSVRRQVDGTWLVRADGQDRWQAEAVVLACPAYEQAALLADQDPALAESVNAIPYNRVAVVALGYRATDVPHRIDGFGYLSPQNQRRDVLGVQWCSSIFPDRALPGTVLLRAMCGGWHRAEIVDWSDDQLLRAVREEMRQTMGITAEPIFHQIIRWTKAIPQYLVGHLDRVTSIEQRAATFPGLFLSGNCYRGVALNDCVERAEVTANKVAEYCGRQP